MLAHPDPCSYCLDESVRRYDNVFSCRRKQPVEDTARCCVHNWSGSLTWGRGQWHPELACCVEWLDGVHLVACDCCGWKRGWTIVQPQEHVLHQRWTPYRRCRYHALPACPRVCIVLVSDLLVGYFSSSRRHPHPLTLTHTLAHHQTNILFTCINVIHPHHCNNHPLSC